ncbi:hypothetical protein CANARDRAFT_9180 [[Candida] arabinofermentans NRRL YB-2248]|uniref:Uncharacterized protein n=1 Tax=[Candida] arabinofermentans NRRL YB-2248 TaxID=983967 RepID=A0A1E4SWL6_9ASCO|nr:hypothetical protein CANARDRAFT_9180 [[Candida] arabinofermentans NRRL YB-2248]
MSKNVQLTPYKSIHDLQKLKDWFYNTQEEDDDVDLRYRGIEKVSAYMTRGNIPHSIEITSLITSSILLDEKLTNTTFYKTKNDDEERLLDEEDIQVNYSAFDVMPIKLSYTMTIIKFVNGLLDPFQKSNFAISLHKLATILNLPSLFVELRHIGTHEFIPSLQILRIIIKCSLNWLKLHYWDIILKDYKPLSIQDDDVDGGGDVQDDSDLQLDELNKSFKILRKIRKDDLSKVYKYGDSTDTGIKYNDALNIIKKTQNTELLINYMIFNNCLILNKIDNLNDKKLNGLKILYKPILEELGYDLCFKLFEKLLIDNDNVNDSNQVIKWLEYFLSNSLKFNKNSKYNSFVNKDTIDSILQTFIDLHDSKHVELLQFFQNTSFIKLNKLQDKIDNVIQSIKTPKTPKRKAVDDDDEEQLNVKRVKRTYFFETHSDWTPTPFGIS